MRAPGFFVLTFVLAAFCTSPPVFGGQYQEAEEAEEAEVAGAESADGAEIFLEGVIVASDPHRSVALVRRSGSGYARPVSVGETIYGFELLEVSDRGIVVRGDQQVLQLSLTGEWEAAPDKNQPDPVPEPAIQEPASVRKELERDSLEARLSKDMPRILAQTALTPRVFEGRVKGFRITHLPGGTVLDDSGIRAGDVLLSINEISLNSPYTLIDLYPRLQAEEEIRVVLERAGETFTYVYDFD